MRSHFEPSGLFPVTWRKSFTPSFDCAGLSIELSSELTTCAFAMSIGVWRLAWSTDTAEITAPVVGSWKTASYLKKVGVPLVSRFAIGFQPSGRSNE